MKRKRDLDRAFISRCVHAKAYSRYTELFDRAYFLTGLMQMPRDGVGKRSIIHPLPSALDVLPSSFRFFPFFMNSRLGLSLREAAGTKREFLINDPSQPFITDCAY